MIWLSEDTKFFLLLCLILFSSNMLDTHCKRQKVKEIRGSILDNRELSHLDI